MQIDISRKRHQHVTERWHGDHRSSFHLKVRAPCQATYGLRRIRPSKLLSGPIQGIRPKAMPFLSSRLGSLFAHWTRYRCGGTSRCRLLSRSHLRYFNPCAPSISRTLVGKQLSSDHKLHRVAMMQVVPAEVLAIVGGVKRSVAGWNCHGIAAILVRQAAANADRE